MAGQRGALHDLFHAIQKSLTFGARTCQYGACFAVSHISQGIHGNNRTNNEAGICYGDAGRSEARLHCRMHAKHHSRTCTRTGAYVAFARRSAGRRHTGCITSLRVRANFRIAHA
jgi:hypothetical protein